MEGIDCLFLLIGSFLIVLLGLWLLKQAVPLHWRRLTLPATTWYAYVLLIVAPSIGIVAFEEPSENYFALGLVLSAAAAIPIGALTANAAWHFQKKETENFYSIPVEPFLPWERKRLWILTGITLLFSSLFFVEIGDVPLWQAFFHPGEYELLARLRQSVTADLQSPFSYVYFMIRQVGWAFVLSCWLGAAWTERWRVKGWLALALLFMFALFYCSATLVRSPAVVLFVVIFFFYYLFCRGRIPLFTILVAAVLAVSIPIVVLFLHNPSRSWESIWIGLTQRIFHAPAKLNFQYIEIFPEQIDFLYGRGIGKFSGFVGLFNTAYEYFPVSQEVYKRLFPTSPYRGSAPAPFIGMAYANWGMFGPPLYGLLIGFILQSIQIWLIRQRKSLFILAAHAVLFYSFFEINRTDFFATLFSYGGLLIPILAAVLQTKWQRARYYQSKLSPCQNI